MTTQPFQMGQLATSIIEDGMRDPESIAVRVRDALVGSDNAIDGSTAIKLCSWLAVCAVEFAAELDRRGVDAQALLHDTGMVLALAQQSAGGV
jgi:hypothetical protein